MRVVRWQANLGCNVKGSGGCGAACPCKMRAGRRHSRACRQPPRAGGARAGSDRRARAAPELQLRRRPRAPTRHMGLGRSRSRPLSQPPRPHRQLRASRRSGRPKGRGSRLWHGLRRRCRQRSRRGPAPCEAPDRPTRNPAAAAAAAAAATAAAAAADNADSCCYRRTAAADSLPCCCCCCRRRLRRYNCC